MRGRGQVKEGCLLSDQMGVHLAELLCARLCHDLAGAVGAVGAGAELLIEEGMQSPMAEEALGLLSASASAMAARLRFLRAALGPIGSDTKDARNLAHAYFAKGHPQGEWRLDWPEGATPPSSVEAAKLLLNLICLAQDCLPRGGTIAVRPGAAEPVSGEGPAVIEGESLRSLASGDAPPAGPRAAQGAYAACLAAQAGGRIAVRQEAGIVRFSVTPRGP